ncbi:MAG TPA: PRC and DUF2382 domain-containing protein [Candidatus Thermoplasmatota archaeon]|nr:PRC and DUF2382 domain-containing protein [Candidatus Thermoplasmatota archaeon]
MLDENRILDYKVFDASGAKVGTLDNVYMDETSGRPELASVKTGWFFGKTHVVPLGAARIDEDRGEIHLPYTIDQIKSAPAYGLDEDLSSEHHRGIYDYYGYHREPGLREREGLGARGGEFGAQEEHRIPLAEEEMQVGKRAVEAEALRLRKVVRTERVSEPVELRREEIHVDRVPASGQQVPANAFQEEDVTIKATREEPVVGKTARVREEARVFKTADTEVRNIEGDVKREELETDRGTGRKNLRRE